MIKKKAISIALCALLVLTMSIPSFAAHHAETHNNKTIHCEKNGIANKLITSSVTSQVGYEARSCGHGRKNNRDKNLQYQVINTYTCTGCEYFGSYAEKPYWTLCEICTFPFIKKNTWRKKF